MDIFFDSAATEGFASFLLNEAETHHAGRVLRYQPGQVVYVTNGRGELFQGVFSSLSGNNLLINEWELIKKEKQSPLISLAVSPLRKPDRNDFLVEKATENGVRAIHYYHSTHTVKKTIRPDRVEKTALSALKQSGNLYLPDFTQPEPVKSIFSRFKDQDRYIASKNAEGVKPIWECYSPGTEAVVFIGPEGDFSTDELNEARQQGIRPVWLGPARYRSETAAIMSLMYLNLLNHLNYNPGKQ
jgi:16S rRNA (uracil1498-N3)-methyltransferase